MKYTPRSLKVCESASQKAQGLLYINHPSFISYKFRKIKFFGFLFEISFVVVFYKKTHPVRIECIVVTNFSCRPVECLHHLIFSISINDARYLTFDLKNNARRIMHIGYAFNLRAHSSRTSDENRDF